LKDYYLLIDGKQAGPYSAEQLHALVAQGQVTNEFLAWHEGLHDWTQLGTVLKPLAPLVAVANSSVGTGVPSLLTSGLVQVDGNSKAGKILFTDSTLFAFHSAPTPTHVFLLFGAIGGLIHGLMSARKAEQSPPAHLNLPEIAALDAPTRKTLATCTLIHSLPIDAGFTAKPTLLGFTFGTAGHSEVRYKGLIFKKRIIAYLKQRGLPV
jgi:hypothetical protein